MPPKKQNPLLAQYEAMLEKRYDNRLRVHRAFLLAAAVMAADDVFALNEDIAEQFQNTCVSNLKEIATKVLEDSGDDKDVEWSKKKVEDRLRSILGNERYEKYKGLYRF